MSLSLTHTHTTLTHTGATCLGQTYYTNSTFYCGLYVCNHFTQTSPMRFLHGTSPVDASESHCKFAPALSVDPLRNPAHVSASTVSGFATKLGFPDLRIQTFLLSYSHALQPGWLVHRLQHACTESTSVKRFANSIAFCST